MSIVHMSICTPLCMPMEPPCTKLRICAAQFRKSETGIGFLVQIECNTSITGIIGHHSSDVDSSIITCVTLCWLLAANQPTSQNQARVQNATSCSWRGGSKLFQSVQSGNTVRRVTGMTRPACWPAMASIRPCPIELILVAFSPFSFRVKRFRSFLFSLSMYALQILPLLASCASSQTIASSRGVVCNLNQSRLSDCIVFHYLSACFRIGWCSKIIR